jgi:RHS repeat-associated protein
MNVVHNNASRAFITRRRMPPRCSRITQARPIEEQRVPRTLCSAIAPDGKLISETVYFNDLPIATLRPKGANAGTPLGQSGTTTGNPSNGTTAANANNAGNNSTTNRVNVEIFYVHADHLGTPRTVTRSTIATGANAPSSSTPTSPGAINKAVWRWDSDPFGTSLDNSKPTENPQLITGTATVQQAGTFKQNHRFPGQLADGESAKYYNYFRDYDSLIGRYTTSDPIGLRGGLSTFAYVLASPIRYKDPKGLIVYICVRAAFASLGGKGNHYYLWNDQNNAVCGRTGGDPESHEPGPPTHACYPINESAGREQDFMNCCRRRQAQGLYVPFVNDCKNTVDDCVTGEGATIPPNIPRRLDTNCSSCYKVPERPPADFQ